MLVELRVSRNLDDHFDFLLRRPRFFALPLFFPGLLVRSVGEGLDGGHGGELESLEAFAKPGADGDRLSEGVKLDFFELSQEDLGQESEEVQVLPL